MQRTPFRRAVAAAVTMGLLAAALPPAARADERTIRCESRRGRYQFCSADTENRVELRRQFSDTPCVLWRTWGYDYRGVWVDNGCRAEFRVGRGGLSGGAAAAIVGGIAAAAIIAGIAANKSGHHDEWDRRVPEWAIGSFRGWDDRERQLLQVNISPGGGVQGWADADEFTGRIAGDRLYVRARTFRIRPNGDGIRLDEQGGRRQQIDLWRTW